MNRKKGYTAIELLIAVSIFAVLIVALVVLLRSSRTETDFMTEKLLSRQEARLAFRKMCNEVRESSKLVLPDGDIHFDRSKYIYQFTSDNPGPDERYGPPTNVFCAKNYYGEMVSYYYYHETEDNDIDENGVWDKNQLRRLNLTQRAIEPATKAEIVAQGVCADNAKPSIFSISRSFPGKAPSSVLIKLSVQKQGLDDSKKYYSLISSVYLRNVGPLVEKE